MTVFTRDIATRYKDKDYDCELKIRLATDFGSLRQTIEIFSS